MRSYGFGYNILIEGLMYGDDRRFCALLPTDDCDFRSCSNLNVRPINPDLAPGYRTYVNYDIDDISGVRYNLNGEPINDDEPINND